MTWTKLLASKQAQKHKTSKKELDNMRALIARDLADGAVKVEVEAEGGGQADHALGAGDARLDLVAVLHDHERRDQRGRREEDVADGLVGLDEGLLQRQGRGHEEGGQSGVLPLGQPVQQPIAGPSGRQFPRPLG